MRETVIVNNEKVYLKKDRFGWRVIHPVKNEDNSWNWKNFFIGGSYWNILKLIGIVGLLIFIIYSYKHDISMCEELIRCNAKCPEFSNTNPFISWG